MASTVRSHKGLVTKKNQIVLSWLEESSKFLQIVQQTNTQHEHSKELMLDVSMCDEYLQLLEVSLTKLTEAFDKLEDTTDEDEDKIDKYIESVEETIVRLHAHRSNLKKMLQEDNTGSMHRNGPNEQGSVAANKLPVIPIPTFTGKKWEWDNFWALYKANVHDQDLSQLQKFNYLLTSLSGEAKQSIARFYVSANNYDKAIQHLIKRYGNKEGIVLELNKSLHSCVARGPSTMEQRQLWDRLSTIAAQLEEHEQQLNNQLTVQIFLQKFHTRIRKAAMERRLRQKDEHQPEWTLDQWLDAVDDIISQEEQLNHMLSAERQIGEYSMHKTTTFRPTPQSKEKWKVTFLCECCGIKGHRWNTCPQIPTAIKKRRFLVESNRCLNCGSANHRLASCPSGNCRKCHKKHHTSTCTEDQIKEPENRSRPLPSPQKYIEKRPVKTEIKGRSKPYHSSKQHAVTKIVEREEQHNLTEDQEPVRDITQEAPSVLQVKNQNKWRQSKVILLTGAVKVINDQGQTKEVVVLLDTGSELSFIEERLAKELDLPVIDTTTLELSTFGSPSHKMKSCAVTNLILLDRDGKEHKVQLYRNDYITSAVQRANLSKDDSQFIRKGNFHLSLPPKEEGELRPQILLGCDYLWNFIEPGKKLNLPSGLQLIPTKLGYIISGRQRWSKQGSSSTVKSAITCTLSGGETEKEKWDRYWSLESTGTEEYTGTRQTELQKINDEVLRRFKESIERRDDGYYVRLPWKENHPDLPDNKALALKRLKKVLEIYQKDDEILQAYDKTFKDQLGKGVIEEVSQEEPDEGQIIHYLPHQAVITPLKETTKIRIVFDASAHYKNCPCLNDVLHQGPLILPNLTGVILRFRFHKIAVMSDIEKAFLQVRLQERDRDATRCIWVRSTAQPPTQNNLVIYRFTRVTFGINASPFLLSATIDYHLENTANKDDMTAEIRNNLYVDNLFFGAQSSSEALTKYAHTKNLFRELNMNLREYRSNDEHFNKAIKESDRMQSTCPKVLGIPWKSEIDKFVVKGSMGVAKERITKRTVTQQLASVYDPLGFLVPLLLPAKIFLQSLWKEELEWDTVLNPSLQDQWRQISTEVSTFYKEVHRQILTTVKRTRLIIFTDASQCAIAACAYLVSDDESNLVMGRSKLPSIKTSMTIPKLETL